VYPLSDTAALKLTTAKYYTPSGRCIHRDDHNTRESQLAINEDEVSEDGESTGQPASRLGGDKNPEPSVQAADSAETFHTVGGRPVLGGGGIRPDIMITQPNLTDFAIDLERKNFFFKYAIRHVSRFPKENSTKVTPAMVDEFKKLLAEENFEYDPAKFQENSEYIERGMRRELTRRLHGSKAAYLVAIEGDEQLKKALDLFAHGQTVKQLYALSPDDLQPVTTAQMKEMLGSP